MPKLPNGVKSTKRKADEAMEKGNAVEYSKPEIIKSQDLINPISRTYKLIFGQEVSFNPPILYDTLGGSPQFIMSEEFGLSFIHAPLDWIEEVSLSAKAQYGYEVAETFKKHALTTIVAKKFIIDKTKSVVSCDQYNLGDSVFDEGSSFDLKYWATSSAAVIHGLNLCADQAYENFLCEFSNSQLDKFLSQNVDCNIGDIKVPRGVIYKLGLFCPVSSGDLAGFIGRPIEAKDVSNSICRPVRTLVSSRSTPRPQCYVW